MNLLECDMYYVVLLFSFAHCLNFSFMFVIFTSFYISLFVSFCKCLSVSNSFPHSFSFFPNVQRDSSCPLPLFLYLMFFFPSFFFLSFFCFSFKQIFLSFIPFLFAEYFISLNFSHCTISLKCLHFLFVSGVYFCWFVYASSLSDSPGLFQSSVENSIFSPLL